MLTKIVDASVVVAAADRRDPNRTIAQDALRSGGRLVVSAQVSAEVDYLLGSRLGPESQVGFLADVAAGTIEVLGLEHGEYAAVLRLARQYRDLRPGLADLSSVVLAARFDTLQVLTFDQRHFRALQPLQGGAFILLPWDGR